VAAIGRGQLGGDLTDTRTERGHQLAVGGPADPGPRII
jgi:hypothetical protein